jgi:hypothetical protein
MSRAVCIGGPCDGQRFEIPDYRVKQGDTYIVRIPEPPQYRLFENPFAFERRYLYTVDLLEITHDGHIEKRTILRDPTLSISGAFLLAIDGYGGRS